MDPTDAERWFFCPQRLARPRVRLVCIPHAGGAATVFLPWARRLPPDIEMRAVQLPGRGARFKELAHRALDLMVADIGRAMSVSSWNDSDLVLFGHSMGALVAFELARRLRGHRRLVRLVLSGHRAPQLPARHALFHRMDDDELIAALKRLNGIPGSVAGEPGLLQRLLPTLRADLLATEAWTYQRDEPLDVPILAFQGDRDPHVTFEELDPWRQQTRGGFALRCVPGDHFSALAAQGQMVDEIARVL
jgi:medium-chain acyl-[acyl-carrier-protein] hydrolase